MKFLNTFSRSGWLVVLFVLLTNMVWAQRTVRGKVTDAENGEALVGATVSVVGTTRGAATDIDGNFTVEVPEGSNQLRVAYTGYAEQVLEIGASNVIDVSMAPGTALDEVVVVGYGAQRRRDVTGAVGSVSSENFNKGAQAAPEQLIQGKIAGVNVTNTSGEPGAGIDIQIRGAGSIRSGNGPLFVIDGVPLNSANSNSGSTDVGFGTAAAKNPLSFLNPNDIESIDVLKDASAAAIYGARGANGVVLITTKKGIAGRTTVDYSGSYGISTLPRKLDVLSGSEYVAATDAIYGHPDSNNAVIPEFRGINTDWQDATFRQAGTQNHSLSFGGGAGKSTYYASLGLFDQEGIVIESRLRRYTGRFNFSQKALNDRLNFALNLTASQVRDNSVPLSNNSGFQGDVIINSLRLNPTFPIYIPDTLDADGNQIFYNPGGSNINTLQFLDVFDDQSRQNRVLGNLTTSFDIWGGLVFHNNLGVDNAVTDRAITLQRNGLVYSPEGFFSALNKEVATRLVENYLTYAINSGNHNVDLLAGHAYQRDFQRERIFNVRNLTDNGIQPINNPSVGTNLSTSPPSGNAQVNELQSFYGRVNYGFLDGRYQLTGTVRADGSTRFGEDNKYGIFPSFAAGWRLSDEPFLDGVNNLDNLKLRAGWGQTGIQEIPNKITQSSFGSSTGNGAWLDGTNFVNGIVFNRTPNSSLQWEVSTQTNVGLDASFGNGRFTSTINWFNRVSTQTLIPITSQAPAPTNTVWVNLDGKIINSGLELELGYMPVRNSTWTWGVNGNATFLKNTVEDMPFSRILTGGLHGQGLSGVQINVIKNDEPLGSFLLFDWEGLEPNADGKLVNKFRDVNGDGIITDGDKIIAGSALPTFTWGLGSNFTYGSFDASVFFNGVHGNQIYNNTYNAIFTKTGLASGTNATSDEVSSTEDVSNTPTPSTRYLEDGDFVRFNNASVGYTFRMPGTSWFKSIRLSVTGQNLALFTNYKGYDPEVNIPKPVDEFISYGIDYSTYPRARTFTFGLNASF
jgi:TonB-linked SusC/RagA family outer membrane protein